MQNLVDFILNILNFFYFLGFKNYGIAIILMTIAIKIALYPLSLQSIQQMSSIQKIQPEFERLREKHKDNPEKLQKELIELYQRHGVNPFGGCLPILLQIPVFIALFMALNSQIFRETLALNPASAKFLWIPNISYKDPIYILPILIGISTYFSQKTMPGATNNEQAKMMMTVMPILITIISLEFAAGIQLYWFMQNLISILQQIYISGKIKT